MFVFDIDRHLAQVMVQFLFPLTWLEVMAYHDRDVLVEVHVMYACGEYDICTFDPTLLPLYLKDIFLQELFQWAFVQDILLLSSFGTWSGKDPGSEILDLWPLYCKWLNGLDAMDFVMLE